MSGFAASLAAVSGTAKASSGHLRGLCAVNRNAAVRYLQLFDSASAPNTGAVPIFQFPVPTALSTTAVGMLVLSDIFGPDGWAFSNGITWGFSSATNGTYTAATAADHDFVAVYA